MTGGAIPVKTAEGQAELGTRQRGLSQRHRTVLVLVDGRRTAAEVRALAAQAGAPDGCFDELLALGLIELPAAPAASITAARDAVPSVPVPLDDTLLPSVRSLPPDSSSFDAVLGGRQPPESWLPDEDGADGAPRDGAVEQARELLVRAVRQEAPLAGTLTVLKLRRARTRDELFVLLDDVEARLGKRRSLTLEQTLQSVRRLLGVRGRDRSAA
jgi:hypothetical protein